MEARGRPEPDLPPDAERDAEPPPKELSLWAASGPWELQLSQATANSPDLDRWASELRKRSFLLLVSDDSGLLLPTAEEITAKLSGYHSARMLKDDLELEPGKCIVNAALPRQEGESAAVILAEATLRMPAFLDSMMKTSRDIRIMESSLRDKELLLLVYTNDRVLGWNRDPEMKARLSYLPCFRLPFESMRLRQECAKQQREDWEDLYKKLCRQRQLPGLWSREEGDFFGEFIGYLNQGRLLEVIDNRSQGLIETAAEEMAADRLLSPQTPLENAVLFTATFFPNLSMRDFERLLLLLLGEQSQETKRAVFVLGPDGEGRGEEVAERRKLSEIWSETYPDVLKRCRLRMQTVDSRGDGSSSRSIVDFTEPELRGNLRSAFVGPHAPIFLPLFRQLRAARQLFAEGPEVVSAAVRLLVETALAHPGEFSGPGLGGLLPPPATSTDSGAATDLPALLDAKLALLRFQPCLRAFLQEPQLRGMVNRFLQELLAARRVDDLVDLVWMLRGVAAFQALPWLKRTLEESNEEARRRASVKLGAKLRQGLRTGAAAEVVQGVFRWLPEPGTTAGSPSAAFAGSFFVDLCEDLLFGARRRSRAAAAPNPLLAAARGGGDELEKVAVAWMLHPELAPILSRRFAAHFTRWIYFWLVPPQLGRSFDDQAADGLLSTLTGRWVEALDDPGIAPGTPLDRFIFPALVVADWAVELDGQDPPSPPDLALFEGLSAALVAQCDARRRLVLCVLWLAVEECLLDVQVFLESLDPFAAGLDRKTAGNLRMDLQRRRRSIKRLRLDLQARGRTATSS